MTPEQQVTHEIFVKARAEERRKAGQPVYEGLTRTPDVELD